MVKYCGVSYNPNIFEKIYGCSKIFAALRYTDVKILQGFLSPKYFCKVYLKKECCCFLFVFFTIFDHSHIFLFPSNTSHYPKAVWGGGGDRVWWFTVADPCMTGDVGASVVWGLGGVWVVYGGGELVVPLVEVVSGGGVSYRLLMILARLDNETFNQIKNTDISYRSS